MIVAGAAGVAGAAVGLNASPIARNKADVTLPAADSSGATFFAGVAGTTRTAGTLAKVNLALSALPVVPGADREQLATRLRIAPDIDYVERAFDEVKAP